MRGKRVVCLVVPVRVWDSEARAHAGLLPSRRLRAAGV